MATFLLALVLVFAIATQLFVARLADRLGASAPLLVTGLVTSALAAAAMAWAGAGFAALLPPRAARMLAAFALALAAAECAWPLREGDDPREPTRSLGAIGIVLLARQLGDAARFVVFALAAGAIVPFTAALGGAIAGGAAVAIGWSAGKEALLRWPVQVLRRVLAGLLLVAALFVGLDARFAAG